MAEQPTYTPSGRLADPQTARVGDLLIRPYGDVVRVVSVRRDAGEADVERWPDKSTGRYGTLLCYCHIPEIEPGVRVRRLCDGERGEVVGRNGCHVLVEWDNGEMGDPWDADDLIPIAPAQAPQEVCYCGTPMDQHTGWDGHTAVPMPEPPAGASDGEPEEWTPRVGEEVLLRGRVMLPPTYRSTSTMLRLGGDDVVGRDVICRLDALRAARVEPGAGVTADVIANVCRVLGTTGGESVLDAARHVIRERDDARKEVERLRRARKETLAEVTGLGEVVNEIADVVGYDASPGGGDIIDAARRVVHERDDARKELDDLRGRLQPQDGETLAGAEQRWRRRLENERDQARVSDAAGVEILAQIRDALGASEGTHIVEAVRETVAALAQARDALAARRTRAAQAAPEKCEACGAPVLPNDTATHLTRGTKVEAGSEPLWRCRRCVLHGPAPRVAMARWATVRRLGGAVAAGAKVRAAAPVVSEIRHALFWSGVGVLIGLTLVGAVAAATWWL